MRQRAEIESARRRLSAAIDKAKRGRNKPETDLVHYLEMLDWILGSRTGPVAMTLDSMKEPTIGELFR